MSLKKTCTSKYAKCQCKNCKRKTKLRAKPTKKFVLDKCNNGIKRLFVIPPEKIQRDTLPNVEKKKEICEHCGSEDVVVNINDCEKYCEDCGLWEQIYPNNHSAVTIVYANEILSSIKYYNNKIIDFIGYMNIFRGHLFLSPINLIDKVKQKLTKPQPSKKDVLKVLKSDFKDNVHAVHTIYYEITGKPAINFMNDLFYMKSYVENLLKFYWKTKPRDKRNYFNYRYVLFHLLKRRNYPVTLKDFPEIRGFKDTKKLCEDFDLQNL